MIDLSSNKTHNPDDFNWDVENGRKPNTKSLYVLCFTPKDDAPFYLIRFSTNDNPPEREQREKGYIKLYVADDFEQVKNFCKEYL